MPFDWSGFISIAENLCDTKNDQASLRTSVSRAYYGVFGKVKIYCLAKYNLRDSFADGIHQKIIGTLKESANNQEYSLGNTLSQLRGSRNDADYNSHTSFSKPQVQEVIRKSKNLLVQLVNLNSEDNPDD